MHRDTDIARRRIMLAGGAFIAWPFAARAQPALRRIGYLTSGARPTAEGSWFEDGLRELGYAIGRDVAIEYRAAEGRLERFPQFVDELVAMRVDVLVVAGPSPLRAARERGKTTPIVMLASSSDPVGEGLVPNLAKPGGNLTGLTYATSPERFGKQLELLKLAAPATTRVGVFWDTDLAMFRRSWATPMETAARQLGISVIAPSRIIVERDAVKTGVEAIRREGADALFVVISGATFGFREHVAAVALRYRLPTVAAFKSFTQSGGLLSYGPDLPALYRRGAVFVDRILRGGSPGDLPIELPSKYELAINLKTAKALGLDIPNELLLRADEVIR